VRKTSTSPSSPDLRIFRVASLTLANAMLFQEILSQTESTVKPLRKTLASSDPIREFEKQWKHISDKIDFAPIFKIAREILLCFPSTDETKKGLEELAEVSIKISMSRAALRHDLMGRIFHKLLADAKFFGAFYTKIPSATILLKLAIEESQLPVDWSEADDVARLRIGDLACGTGTLLKAALASCADKHIDTAVSQGKIPNPDRVHEGLIEDGLWGFDILGSAVHLAASALAMHDPRVRTKRMGLYAVPLGGRSNRLGSIEFAKGWNLQVQRTLLGASIGAERATGESGEARSLVLPELDIVTMNPPFTRSVYGNLLFGNVNTERREELQTELKKIVKTKHLSASITAGLGSVFVAIADKRLKSGGILALVLPKAVLDGESWKPTRDIFKKYRILFIIGSHQPGNWNFSETTALSEVMIILQKSTSNSSTQETRFINIWRQPKNGLEAFDLVNQIRQATPARLDSSSGISGLSVGQDKSCEVSSLDLVGNPDVPWSLPISFCQTDLCRAAYQFTKGKIFLPGQGVIGDLSFVLLSDKMELGPDGRDIADGFSSSNSTTTYQAFWGYDSTLMTTLSQNPNACLSPLVVAKAGRPLRDSNLLWSRAGCLMLAKEMWLTLNCVTSTMLPTKALSNVWWPTRWLTGSESEKRAMEKRMVLWLNSTLGIFSMLMRRQETRGSWSKFPKNWYEQLPIPDLSSLDSNNLQLLDNVWDRVASVPLLPLPKIDVDPTRAIIDDTFATILGTSSFATLRNLLAKEPILSQTLP